MPYDILLAIVAVVGWVELELLLILVELKHYK